MCLFKRKTVKAAALTVNNIYKVGVANYGKNSTRGIT